LGSAAILVHQLQGSVAEGKLMKPADADQNRDELRIGRILSELLDSPGGDTRIDEAALLERHPDVARELKRYIGVIRKIRLSARLRRSPQAAIRPVS
jgi:hypothetical protein